jgi:HEAT repeat protein
MRYLDARLGPGAKKMPGLEDALINIVGNGDRLLYPVALDLLRKSGSAKAVPAIIEAARRNIGDGLIRRVAFRALAALGGDESIRFVLGSVKGIAVKEMNEKANQELSGDAFDALTRFDRETLRKTLSGIIAEPPDEDMLFAALLGTIVLERDEFVAPLMKIMNDEKASERARSGAIIALGFKKAGQALSALTKIAGAEDSDAAYSAAFALGQLGELGGAQALIDRLRAEKLKGAPDEFLVALIVVALQKISGEDHGEDATGWQQWYNQTARAASGGRP